MYVHSIQTFDSMHCSCHVTQSKRCLVVIHILHRLNGPLSECCIFWIIKLLEEKYIGSMVR